MSESVPWLFLSTASGRVLREFVELVVDRARMALQPKGVAL